MNKGKTSVVVLGSSADLTYSYDHLGSNAAILEEIASGNHAICEKFSNAKLPLMIVGRDALTRPDSEGIVQQIKQISNKYGFVDS